jgi:hypothetical protein
MVPKPQHNDSVLSKEFRTRSITSSGEAKIVSGAVQFNRELCDRTVEIKCVWLERVLAPKFKTRKISVA